MAEEDEIRTLVEKVWARIQKEGHKPVIISPLDLATHFNEKPAPTKFWTTAPLFVSSTFRDMGPDHDYIVKRVMPELVDYAEKKGIRLVECDLRWGVQKNSSGADTVETCLGELEYIKANSKGQPLFLCLLGERYGWIPHLTEIPFETADRYKWIDTLSITHMEIMQGAIRCKNRNALFCFRSPQFVFGIPPEKQEPYVEKGLLEKMHLAKLKKTIVGFLPDPRDQVYTYDATVKKITSSSSAIDVEFRQEFADKVLRFFKAAIDRLFPDRGSFKPPNELEQENFYQWTCFERYCVSTFGIEDWTSEITTYVLGCFTGESGSSILKIFEYTNFLYQSEDDTESEKSQAENWPCAVEPDSPWTSHPICLISDPGHGKTSVMTCLAKEIMSSSSGRTEHVFFHYCGITVSPNASSYDLLLMRLIQFLLKVLESDKDISDVTDQTSLYQTATFYDLLWQLFDRKDKRVIIMIDSVELLRDVGSTIDVQWSNFFPIRFPPNCVVVFTANMDARLWVHKYVAFADATMLKMPDTAVEVRSTIVTKYFEIYNKRLDPEQLYRLVNKDGANLPLWLKLACEELRIFGSYKLLTAKIEHLDKALEGLLVQIFARIIKDTRDLPIGRFLSYLSVSPQPLPDDELPRMLGSPEKNEQLKPFELARLKLILKPYITVMGSGADRTVILPFHSTINSAASQICKLSKVKTVEAKRGLANYIINYASDSNKSLWSHSLINMLWECDSREELLKYLQYKGGRVANPSFRTFTLLKFRCTNRITAESTMTVPFRCCFNCSLMVDFELNGKHLEFCWICKSRLQQSTGQVLPAVACANHREYPLKVGEFTCRFCGMFRGSTYTQWMPIQLCHDCHRLSCCSHMTVEHSWQRFPTMIPVEND